MSCPNSMKPHQGLAAEDLSTFGTDPWWLVALKAVFCFAFLMLTVLISIVMERKVVAWFYPKDASGAAAAVWFEAPEAGNGGKVYQLDFEAIQPGQPAPPRRQAAPATPRPASPPAGSGTP